MSPRLPIPDNDKTAEALALTKWLVNTGPSATAAELKQAGERLEDCITLLHRDGNGAGRMALEEAVAGLEQTLATFRALLRS